MTETLLRSLRDRMLDESESLAGLLRKCLFLGAETGSDALRQWARNELNGYDEGDSLPRYRKLPMPPLSADTISGNTWAKNMTYSVLQLPVKAQEAVGSEFLVYQPIEELEGLSAKSSLSFTNAGLTYAQHIWNGTLGPYQEVANLRYTVSGAVFAGVLGQIRTQLVDLIADLTANTPLEELPRKELVDAAVGTHIGTQYNTTIKATNASTAIGDGATANTGLSIEDAIRLLDAVADATSDVGDEELRAELLSAVTDLRAEVQKDAPDTGAVVKKVGRLRRLAAGVGSTVLAPAVSGAVEALTALALGGAFG